MSLPRFDVAVVGLGMIGSAALHYLSHLGLRAVGVGPTQGDGQGDGEQDFEGPFSSHFDQGRIARRLDRKALWSLLARRSIQRYAALEAASGLRFWDPRGAWIALADPQAWSPFAQRARELGLDKRVSDGSSHENGYQLPAGVRVIEETTRAGVIAPRRLIEAQRKLARKRGATVVDEVGLDLQRKGSGWEIQTKTQGIAADRVLLCTGPYPQSLHGYNLPVTVWPEPVILAEVKPASLKRWANLPALVYALEDERLLDCYVVPPLLYPDGKYYFKLGGTHRDAAPLRDDEAKRKWMQSEDADGVHDDLLRVLHSLLWQAEFASSRVRACMITKSESGLPLLDRLGEGLYICGAGNGYAAKSSDALGELAARFVAQGGEYQDPEIDLQSLRAPNLGGARNG